MDKNHEVNKKRATKKKIIVLVVSLVVLVGAIATFFLMNKNNNDDLPVVQDKTPTPSTSQLPNEPAVPELVTSTGFEVKKPFELLAENSDEAGTATDSEYRILLSKSEYTAEQLYSNISIMPETDFTIEKSSNNDYLLKPSDPLMPNKIYSISFSDEEQGISYSWAFQTRNEFFVTSTLPRNQATYVPVNTGIEVTFSGKVENSLSSHFEISPKADGRFEIHKNTVVFVPNNPLSYDTIYTVTVKNGFSQKAGGQSLKEDTVFSFQTMPEPDKSNEYNSQSFEFARNVYNFYPNELPFLSVYTYSSDDAEVEFYIYQYHNDQEFRDDLFVKDDRPNWCTHYKNKIDYSDKEEVLNIKTTLLPDQESNYNFYYGTKYIGLPEPLPEGYYIAVMRYNGMERKALVQINSMAVYVGGAENKTIGFIYDSLTSNPIEGAEIVFDEFSIKTGADGLAVSDDVLISNDGFRLKNYTIKRDGHPSYYSTLGRGYSSSYNNYYYYDYDRNFRIGYIHDKYWGYLFTDRDIYLPSDTLNVWLIISQHL